MNSTDGYERISIILQRAKKGPFSYDEISEKLKIIARLKGNSFSYSLRTFQRNLIEISDLHGIVIRGNRKTGLYEIKENESSPINEHLLESMDIIQTFQLSANLENFVFFDGNVSKGTEHLSILVHAIKNQRIIQFDHNKGWTNVFSRREIKPLALKEVKKSWYLIGLNEANQFRNYGMNRIANIKVTAQKFEKDQNLDLVGYYKNVIGILNEGNVHPQRIILEFSTQQGNIIKSKPIHPTQTVLKDDEICCQISLNLKVSEELISEILTFGEHVRIIEPADLRVKMREVVSKMLKNLND